MNLLQSTKTYDELLTLMEACGYSTLHIKRVKREINWLAVNQDDYGISSYEEAYRIRSGLTESEPMMEQYRAVYSLFKRYCAYGDMAVQTREPLFRRDTYTQLNPYFKTLLDAYEESSKKRGLKSGTYRSAISACSGLLLFFQENGHETLGKVSEKDVLAYFMANNGRNPSAAAPGLTLHPCSGQTLAFIRRMPGVSFHISQHRAGTEKHKIRHTKAMHLTEADINPIFIRDFLGHTDLKVTEVYSKTSVKMKKAALDKMKSGKDVVPDKPKADWTEDKSLLDWLNGLKQ